MLAAMSGAPELITVPITSSQSVTIPFGVSRLESASGKGANGTPYVPGDTGYDTYKQTTFYPAGGGEPTVGPLEFVGATYNASPPEPYCEGTGNVGGSRTETCYSYITFDLSQPKTVGASATGFGLTFPGGDGVPATVTTYGPTPVTGGQSYPVVIPSGGSITITYYR